MKSLLGRHDQVSVTLEGRIGEVVYCDNLLVTKLNDEFYLWWAVEGKYSHQMIYHMIGKYVVEKSKCDDRTIAVNIIQEYLKEVRKS